MSEIVRTSAPFYVQLEVTESCNQRCFFCYNTVTRKQGEPLSTKEIKALLEQMRAAGVFSINFNGGEPLRRSDFFDLAAHAKALGFDIHLNTNATLVDEATADKIAAMFPSICTSVLASTPERHNALVGTPGAFARMRRGVDHLLARGVKVEINVCTFKGNCEDLFAIASVMAHPGVHVFCVTRYILTSAQGVSHVLGPAETESVLASLERIRRELPTYSEVKLPGPVPYCELPDRLREKARSWNTPCQVGYGLCRISPQGDMTPCPLSEYRIGNVRETDFAALWASPLWERFSRVEHLPPPCRVCEELKSCRGGCIYYDEALVSRRLRPHTQKWAF